MSPFTHLPPRLLTVSLMSAHSAFKNWVGFIMTCSFSVLKFSSLRCSGLNSSSILPVVGDCWIRVFGVLMISGLVTGLGWVMDADVNVSLNSGVGWFSARSWKLSLLMTARIWLENKSYRKSKSSILSGRLDATETDFPCRASVMNLGASLITLVFTLFHAEMFLYTWLKRNCRRERSMQQREQS